MVSVGCVAEGRRGTCYQIGMEDGERRGKMWVPDVAEGPWLLGYGREKAKDPKGKNLGLGFFFLCYLQISKIAPPPCVGVGNSYL